MALAPHLEIDEDRITVCTNVLARAVWLFSYVRQVVVDRRRRRVTISTTRLWFWRESRVVAFDHISRIICRGQELPSLSGGETAFFLIALGLKDGGADLELFTVLENQPRRGDWIDRISGESGTEARVGDEAAVSLVDLLQRYLGVPIARH